MLTKQQEQWIAGMKDATLKLAEYMYNNKCNVHLIPNEEAEKGTAEYAIGTAWQVVWVDKYKVDIDHKHDVTLCIKKVRSNKNDAEFVENGNKLEILVHSTNDNDFDMYDASFDTMDSELRNRIHDKLGVEISL